MSDRAADIRDVTLVGLSSIAAAAVTPLLPFVGLPLAALGLSWLTYRHGWIAGSIAAVLAAVAGALVFEEPVLVVLLAPALLAVGPMAAVAMRRMSALRAVMFVTLVVFAALIAYDAAAATEMGRTIAAQRRVEGELIRKAAVASAKGSPPADVSKIEVVAAEVSGLWTRVWPAYYAYIAGLSAGLSILAVTWAARRRDVRVNALPKLAQLDVSGHFVWPVIVGLAASAYAIWTGEPNGWAGTLGANLLLIVRPVLALQGIAVFAHLYDRAGLGKLGRAVGYTLLVLTEAMIPSVSVLGLIDLLRNFRKLGRDGAEPLAEKSDIGG